MDGRFIKLADGKAWRCPNGHLLGIMRRERIGHAVRGYRLYLLPTALEHDPDFNADLFWKSRTFYTQDDIWCECCETQKTWWAGEGALNKVLANARRNMEAAHESI